MALVAISGQKNQVIIFIAHTARLLDVEQIFDSDLIIYKMPSAAHSKFERREIAEHTAAARKALMSKKQFKKWSYVIDFHNDISGLLSNGLPSFWTEALSTAWADLDIMEAVSNGKKKGKEKR